MVYVSSPTLLKVNIAPPVGYSLACPFALTIIDNATAEVVEKKSKFIANSFYIESVEEAESKIKEIKKKYYDARHNCFAYSIFGYSSLLFVIWFFPRISALI